MSVTISGTSGLAGVNGSASTPAVQGEDTNTGVFFPAADTVAVATGGSERMRVDSSGNVGIGTSSPNSKLQVNTGTNLGGVLIGFSGGSSNFYDADLSVFRSGNGTERARIDSSGNLLVGTTSGSERLKIFGSSAAAFVSDFYDSRTDGASGAGMIRFTRTSGGVGSINTSTTSTSYVTSSDYRLKENVQPMQDALAKIAQLNPVTYTWKADGSAGQGFIAHELQAVVPDCVTGEKDAVDANGNPQYQGVDTSFLVATLVKAIQELTARVAELEAQ